MIKFFRKIRRNLLEEKKIKNYLVYAFGEILLVVIGILIALNINNWNETKKQTAYNFQILSQLKEENLINLNDLKSDQEYRENLPESLLEFMSFLKNEEIEKDTANFQKYMMAAARATSHTFSSNVLEKYIGSDLTTDAALLKELVILDEIQTNLGTMSKHAMEYKMEEFFGFLSPEVDFENLEIHSYDLIKSLKFQNNILLMASFESEVLYTFNEVIAQQERVDSIIEIKLNPK